ncbi:MAG TPA: ABC transporter permease [Candidatus Limnocylindrales bacterium]|nr:ABC transporter permease [Candidatus Limnocylindrales bacterium]
MSSVIRPLFVIVRLTLLDALRRRILWVLVGLTVFVVGLSGLGFERLVSLARENGSSETEVQLGVSQMLIVVAFMFSFILAMTAAFIGAPAVSADIDSGVLLAILARPIGRSTFLAGRWLGLALVAGAYALASGLLEIGAMKLASGYGPPDPLGAAGAIALQAILILSLTLLFSTRLPSIAGGAIAVVLFGMCWVAGVLGGLGLYLKADLMEQIAAISRVLLPTDGIWRGAIYALEPPVVIAVATESGRSSEQLAANPFFASTGLGPAYLAWVGAWFVIILGLAVLSFRRREL